MSALYHTLICPICQSKFELINGKFNRIAKYKHKQAACSLECRLKLQGKIRNKQTKFQCKTCGKELWRPPSNVPESGNCFCSKSCSAKYTNPKKVKDLKCELCNESRDWRNKRCSKCRDNIKNKMKNMTFGEFKIIYKKQNQQTAWATSRIRDFCRAWNKDLVGKPCQNCSYILHTELCHIKAIPKHSDGETLQQINSQDNLLVLCKNCHWEFDHSILTLEEIRLK